MLIYYCIPHAGNLFPDSSAVEQLAVPKQSVRMCDNISMDKRTYKDRAKYNIRAVAKRRKKIKAMAIEYKGGKCQICGYCKYVGALDFHHKDETKKSFGLGTNGLTRSWAKTKVELDKCILVCANCHREIHGGLVQLPKEILDEKQG